MGFTIRRKPDLDALDWQQDAEVLRRRRQLVNWSTALTAVEQRVHEDERRLAELGPNLDALLDVLDASESGDAGGALTAHRQAIDAQREAIAERLKANRGILREQDRLGRRLAEAVSEAESKARAARADRLEAAYRAATEGMAKALLDAASYNAELTAMNRIAGGVGGWPQPWAELDVHSASALGVLLRTAAAFGCRVEPIVDEVDRAQAAAAERFNRRQRRRAEIETKAEEIRREEGNPAADRYLATASVEA